MECFKLRCMGKFFAVLSGMRECVFACATTIRRATKSIYLVLLSDGNGRAPSEAKSAKIASVRNRSNRWAYDSTVTILIQHAAKPTMMVFSAARKSKIKLGSNLKSYSARANPPIVVSGASLTVLLRSLHKIL